MPGDSMKYNYIDDTFVIPESFLFIVTYLLFSVCQIAEKNDGEKTIHIFTSRSVPQLKSMLEEFKKVLKLLRYPFISNVLTIFNVFYQSIINH